jgi:hypothetical protein
MTDAAATMTRAPQHMRALARANEVRLARAELKRRIAAGAISVGEVILTCPREAAGMPIGDLLISQRSWGATRCRKVLDEVAVSQTKSVGSMTDRQRRALAAML